MKSLLLALLLIVFTASATVAAVGLNVQTLLYPQPYEAALAGSGAYSQILGNLLSRYADSCSVWISCRSHISILPSYTVVAGPVIQTGLPSPSHDRVKCPPFNPISTSFSSLFAR